MKKIVLLFVLLGSNLIFSQYQAIDKKMDEIPRASTTTTTKIAGYISQNFTSENDKIRAAFYWVSSNIRYDVENMFNLVPQTPEEKITATLKTKKGVCMHYSEVFNDLVKKMGIRSYIIDGYTKQFGKIAKLTHSWNACMMDGKWYLFDPTWASGYVNDQGYFRKQNDIYYKSDTAEFLKTHMPFDYMWQLNEKPITNDEFYQDIAQSNSIATSFDFNAAIEQFEQLSEQEKVKAKMERIQKAGIKNGFITEKYNALKKDFESYKNNNSLPKLEFIVSEFNNANKLLNEFIKYRNSRFTPMVSDDKIKEKAQIPYDKIIYCEEELSKITDVSKENMANFMSLKKAVGFAKKRFEEQLNFVNDYLSKNTSERAAAFTARKKR